MSTAYISKINSNCEKKIILMIPNEEKEGFYYFALKFLRGVTSKNHDDFYCLNCFHSFRTEFKLKSQENLCKNKDFCGILILKSHEKVCKNKDFYGIEMPSGKNNILELI